VFTCFHIGYTVFTHGCFLHGVVTHHLFVQIMVYLTPLYILLEY
jgi:hypothetical protein